MAQIDYPLSADEGPDDLPITLRRERDAREREARERAARERGEPDFGDGSAADYGGTQAAAGHGPARAQYSDAPVAAVVKRFDVPFFRLMFFFLKAAVAAIPAIVLLVGLVVLAVSALQTYFPWLMKLQIFIHFPE